jgi:hypothetical protein
MILRGGRLTHADMAGLDDFKATMKRGIDVMLLGKKLGRSVSSSLSQPLSFLPTLTQEQGVLKFCGWMLMKQESSPPSYADLSFSPHSLSLCLCLCLSLFSVSVSVSLSVSIYLS